MEIELKLQEAKAEQVDEIVNLVNIAYRGEVGWTTETDIVQGNRTTHSEIESAILNPNAHLLVVKKNKNLISCVCIEKENDSADIGLFAVHPRMQGKGFGKTILSMAEKYAVEKLGVDKFIMVVVSQRPELISYYERRGYIRTGQLKDYPLHLNVGVPKVKGLTIEFFEKNTKPGCQVAEFIINL